jgi:hypothetical protein
MKARGWAWGGEPSPEPWIGASEQECQTSELSYPGDYPRVRLDRDMRLEPVLPAVHRFVGMPGIGVDHRDHPVRGDLPGDLLPPIGPIAALDGFDVLTGDQRQQVQSLSTFGA